MLNRDQIELIHQDVDGTNTPEEHAAVRSLMVADPEARALEADLRRVTWLFNQAGEREPPLHLKQAILDALPQPARAAPRTEAGWMTPDLMVRWLVSQLRLVTARMEGAIMSKKVMVYGGAAVAITIVIAGILTGFPPLGGVAGTIGGVEQASRYKGRSMTQADVTLQNPEIAALFQNPEIVRLVTSDVFREAMQNSAFRELQANAAYRELQANPAYRELMASAAYRELQANTAFRELQASETFRELQASTAFRELAAQGAFRESQSAEAMRELQASAAYRELMANAAFRELQANTAFRELQANTAFRELQASAAFRQLEANAAYRELQASETFRELQASDAFRELQAAEAFRALSRSQDLSNQFMREAMRVAP